MEQTENGEQQRPVAGDVCNDNSDIEKQLPVAVVEKSLKPRKKKKKKKVSNENGSPPLQSNTKRRKIPRDADAPKYPKTGKYAVHMHMDTPGLFMRVTIYRKFLILVRRLRTFHHRTTRHTQD